MFAAVCVTALCRLLSVSQRQPCSSYSLFMLRCADRLSLWNDECKFVAFLSKLAFKGGFCVQKTDGLLSCCRLHLYMHVTCRRPFFCSTLKPNCYALPTNWVTLTVTTPTTALCRRECNPFFKPANLTRPSPSGVQNTENKTCDNAPTSAKCLCHGTEDENVIICDVIIISIIIFDEVSIMYDVQ